MKEFDNSLEYLNKTLKLSTEDDKFVADLHHEISAVHYIEKRFSEALIHQQKILDIRMVVLGENHPDTIASLNNVNLCNKQLE